MKNIRNFSLITALFSLALCAFAWEAPLVRVSGVESVEVVAPPYDAEVEYIESHGTEYVRVDGGIGTNDTFEAKFRINAITSLGYAFGVHHRTNNYNYAFGLRINTSNPAATNWTDLAVVTPNIPVVVGEDVTFLRGIGIGAASINGVAYTARAQEGDWFACPFYVFAGNNATTEGVDVGPAFAKSKARFYYLKQRGGDGNLRRDLVPVVRYESGAPVGYLYDRVSRNLLSNSGTGAFGVGPVK